MKQSTACQWSSRRYRRFIRVERLWCVIDRILSRRARSLTGPQIIREEPEPSHREELPPRQRTMSSSTVASEHSRLPRHPMPQRPSAFAVRDDATPSRPRRQSVDRLRDTRQPPPPFASHPPRAHHDDFHPSSVPGRDEPPRQDQRFQPAPARAPLPPQAYDRREDAFTPRPDYVRSASFFAYVSGD